MRPPGKRAATTRLALCAATTLTHAASALGALCTDAAHRQRGDAMRANAITMMGQRRPDEDARRRAMVRLNGMMFYSVGLASFLESTAPLDTTRLTRLAEGDGHSDVRLWLER